MVNGPVLMRKRFVGSGGCSRPCLFFFFFWGGVCIVVCRRELIFAEKYVCLQLHVFLGVGRGKAVWFLGAWCPMPFGEAAKGRESCRCARGGGVPRDRLGVAGASSRLGQAGLESGKPTREAEGARDMGGFPPKGTLAKLDIWELARKESPHIPAPCVSPLVRLSN